MGWDMRWDLGWNVKTVGSLSQLPDTSQSIRRTLMSDSTAAELVSKRCLPCEGGVAKMEIDAADQILASLPGWTRSPDGKMIAKTWTVKNFVEGMAFLQRVSELAEAEQHHPDVHLTGYRQVKIELTTHAIGGLSENDFILAAKIEELPVAVKK